MRKTIKQVRREVAGKRGSGRVLGEGEIGGRKDGGPSFFLDELIGRLPCADFDLTCGELLEMLEEEERTVALLRLLGYRNREIARKLGCTERKVERKLRLIRLTWEQTAGEE